MPTVLNEMPDKSSTDTDFCNKIGTFETSRLHRVMSAFGGNPEDIYSD